MYFVYDEMYKRIFWHRQLLEFHNNSITMAFNMLLYVVDWSLFLLLYFLALYMLSVVCSNRASVLFGDSLTNHIHFSCGTYRHYSLSDNVDLFDDANKIMQVTILGSSH